MIFSAHDDRKEIGYTIPYLSNYRVSGLREDLEEEAYRRANMCVHYHFLLTSLFTSKSAQGRYTWKFF